MKGFVLISFLFVLLSSCKLNYDRELVSMLDRWIGKEITFLDSYQFDFILGNKIELINSKGFTIVHCVRSTGCTSCNLKLSLWKTFIHDINKISKKPVSLVFVSNSNNQDLKNSIMPIDSISVVNIKNDSLCLLHELFGNKYFNTILLDQDSKVVTVGNPIVTPKIMNNYYISVTR